jgi:hypothetical protein
MLFRREGRRSLSKINRFPVHVWIALLPQVLVHENSKDSHLREHILAVGREHSPFVIDSLMSRPVSGSSGSVGVEGLRVSILQNAAE